MLRVAGRRLSSSLSWRPAAAAAAAGARGPLAGASGPARDDDDNSARQPRFAIESPFFTAAREMRPLEVMDKMGVKMWKALRSKSVVGMVNPMFGHASKMFLYIFEVQGEDEVQIKLWEDSWILN